MVRQSKMSGYSFVHSEVYFSWEKAENVIVQQEFPIVLGVVLAIVFLLCICLLISVMLSVLCSLVNTISIDYL